jgi:hypothetical protein
MDVTPYSVVYSTDESEGTIASIFRIELTSTLRVKAIDCFEPLLLVYQTTRRHIQVNRNINTRRS